MNGLGLKNYPKLTLPVLESAFWYLSYGKVIFHCQLMCTLTSWVDLPQKTTLNWSLKCWNLPSGSWVMVRSSSMVSWCVQWHHEWTGLEKLPQNDSSNIKIGPQDQKLESKCWKGVTSKSIWWQPPNSIPTKGGVYPNPIGWIPTKKSTTFFFEGYQKLISPWSALYLCH